jgi:hypothetical protein
LKTYKVGYVHAVTGVVYASSQKNPEFKRDAAQILLWQGNKPGGLVRFWVIAKEPP